MGTYINKSIRRIPFDSLFLDSIVVLEEPHRVGDIIDGRIIISGNTFALKSNLEDTEIYDKGDVVRAIRINLIDDIETSTDMTSYGFLKVGENRYCKSNTSIYWANMKNELDKLKIHKPTDEELKFLID